MAKSLVLLDKFHVSLLTGGSKTDAAHLSELRRLDERGFRRMVEDSVRSILKSKLGLSGVECSVEELPSGQA